MQLTHLAGDHGKTDASHEDRHHPGCHIHREGNRRNTVPIRHGDHALRGSERHHPRTLNLDGRMILRASGNHPSQNR